MKNTFGNQITVTIFGESHGAGIGVVLDGLAPGMRVDEEFLCAQLSKRRPSGKISTARRELDEYTLESGVFNGFTTGTPLCIVIPNTAQHSKDYAATRSKARPGHADYTAYCKYHGYEDYRGGGHFSGRITAGLVAAGGILLPALEEKGIRIATHIRRCAGVDDRNFDDLEKDITALNRAEFPVLSAESGEKMQASIQDSAAAGDSVGGILETVVIGLPAGLGEPWFDSVEGLLSHGLFSIPAVKGVSFGDGFELADQRGSEANDPFRYDGDRVVTAKNSNGGINGGITNGMPLVVRTVIKPTPSIYQPQETVDFIRGENATLQIEGRHDPCIVHRARVVVDSICALVVADLLATRYGTDYLGGTQ
ncbi:MAG: chorismate synthase [Clostridia bacterium]|nr:chorismate synthase [Clostridia bacterium]